MAEADNSVKIAQVNYADTGAGTDNGPPVPKLANVMLECPYASFAGPLRPPARLCRFFRNANSLVARRYYSSAIC